MKQSNIFSWKIVWLLIVLIIGIGFFAVVTNNRDTGYDTSDGRTVAIELNMHMETGEYDRFVKEYRQRTGHTMDESTIEANISEEEGEYSAEHLPTSAGIYAIQYLSWTTYGTVESKIRLKYKPYGLLTIKDDTGHKIMIYVLGASSVTSKGHYVKVTGIVLGTLQNEGKIPVLVSTHKFIDLDDGDVRPKQNINTPDIEEEDTRP